MNDFADIPQSVLDSLDRDTAYQMAIDIIVRNEFDPMVVAVELAKEHPAQFCRLAKKAVPMIPDREKPRVIETNTTYAKRPRPLDIPWNEFNLDDTERQEVYRLLLQANKVGAIKRIREFTSWGLKESKDWVDLYSDKLRDRGQI